MQIDVDGTAVVKDVAYEPMGPMSSFTLNTAQPTVVPLVHDTGYHLKQVGSQVLTRDPVTHRIAAADPGTTGQSCTSDDDCYGGGFCDHRNQCAPSLHAAFFEHDWQGKFTCASSTTPSPLCTGTYARAIYHGDGAPTLLWPGELSGYLSSGQNLTVTQGAAYQVDSVTGSAGSLFGTESYSYDEMGRRVSEWGGGALTERQHYYYANGRLASLTNMAPMQRWDEGCDCWIKEYKEQEISYAYDHRGRRVRKQVHYPNEGLTDTWLYFYGPGDKLLLEVLSSELTERTTAWEYVHLNGVPVYQRTTNETGIGEKYLIPDHLGQPVRAIAMAQGTSVTVNTVDVNAFGWSKVLTATPELFAWLDMPYETGHLPLRRPGQYEDIESVGAVFDPATGGDDSIESKLFVYKPSLFYNVLQLVPLLRPAAGELHAA